MGIDLEQQHFAGIDMCKVKSAKSCCSKSIPIPIYHVVAIQGRGINEASTRHQQGINEASSDKSIPMPMPRSPYYGYGC